MKLALVLSLFIGLSAQAHECNKQVGAVVSTYLLQQGQVVKAFKALHIQDLTPGSYNQKYDVKASVLTQQGNLVSVSMVIAADFICEGLKINSVR